MTRLDRIQAMRRKGLADSEIGMHLKITRQRVHALAGPRAPRPKPQPVVNLAENFESRLRGWRERRGLRQEDAAALLRCPVKTYRNWEYGRPPALAQLVLHLVDLLDARP